MWSARKIPGASTLMGYNGLVIGKTEGKIMLWKIKFTDEEKGCERTTARTWKNSMTALCVARIMERQCKYNGRDMWNFHVCLASF